MMILYLKSTDQTAVRFYVLIVSRPVLVLCTTTPDV